MYEYTSHVPDLQRCFPAAVLIIIEHAYKNLIDIQSNKISVNFFLFFGKEYRTASFHDFGSSMPSIRVIFTGIGGCNSTVLNAERL